MTSISFYEARTHLSELLDQVAAGKKVLITRRGKPAAILMPPPADEVPDASEIIRLMKEFRRTEWPTLGPKLTLSDLIEDGRRF